MERRELMTIVAIGVMGERRRSTIRRSLLLKMLSMELRSIIPFSLLTWMLKVIARLDASIEIP